MNKTIMNLSTVSSLFPHTFTLQKETKLKKCFSKLALFLSNELNIDASIILLKSIFASLMRTTQNIQSSFYISTNIKLASNYLAIYTKKDTLRVQRAFRVVFIHKK